uniref:Uncharacterized protein n=1 Tax=Oryza brachyantha TaxID=4533 RepID=J3MI75_ORYBR
MASQLIESHRAGAEIVTGDDICRKKSIELLEELGLPVGLLPLEDIEEFGYNQQTGFLWMVQRKKKKIEHTFKKIKQTVSYAGEVTAFAEKGKLKKITGVKTKELMLWISIVEVCATEASPEKVTFKSGAGISKTFERRCICTWGVQKAFWSSSSLFLDLPQRALAGGVANAE